MRSIFIANLIGYGQELGTGRGVRLSETELDYVAEIREDHSGIAKFGTGDEGASGKPPPIGRPDAIDAAPARQHTGTAASCTLPWPGFPPPGFEADRI